MALEEHSITIRIQRNLTGTWTWTGRKIERHGKWTQLQAIQSYCRAFLLVYIESDKSSGSLSYQYKKLAQNLTF